MLLVREIVMSPHTFCEIRISAVTWLYPFIRKCNKNCLRLTICGPLWLSLWLKRGTYSLLIFVNVHVSLLYDIIHWNVPLAQPAPQYRILTFFITKSWRILFHHQRTLWEKEAPAASERFLQKASDRFDEIHFATNARLYNGPAASKPWVVFMMGGVSLLFASTSRSFQKKEVVL